MSGDKYSGPLVRRDVAMERAFLLGISELDYYLLQRDWDSENHGDLDLVISGDHWPHLVEAIINFSEQHNIPIVKVYEIETAVICVILLMDEACIHLDVCVTPCRTKIFDVDLKSAFSLREENDGVYVIDKDNERKYKRNKSIYKKSALARINNKIRNMPVLIERLIKTTLYLRGVVLYIPYLIDDSLLCSKIVRDTSRNYLLNDLLNKYKSCK